MSFINLLLRRVVGFFGSVRLALGSLLFAGMILAIAALFFFGWLAEEMLEGGTKYFDETVRNYLHEFASPVLTNVMQLASFLGSTLFLTVFGLAIVVALYLRNHRHGATLFAITTIGASFLLVTLKLAFGRTRPEPFFDTILPVSYSFPSGHSLASFCFYGALAVILADRTDKLRLQIIIWIASIVMILLIGTSRIYLGVHYPSDVIAGFIVGLIWVITIAIGDKLIHVKRKTMLDKSNNPD